MRETKKQMVERTPRSTIDSERLEKLNIDYNESFLKVTHNSENIEKTKIISIVNISKTGVKLAIEALDKEPEVDKRVNFFIKSENEEFDLRGRIAWLEKIADGHWWMGLDLNPSGFVQAFYEFISGEPFDKVQ